MIEVKFKETESNEVKRFRISKTAIGCPICKDGKCIGQITDVDTKTNEYYGYIFDHDAVIELSQDFQKMVSVEIVKSK